MSCLPFVMVLWLAFLIPAAPLAAACWFFGRPRVTRFKWESALLVVPFLIWLLLVMIEKKGKSSLNAAGEPFLLGCGVALVCVARVVVGKKWKERTLALSLFGACCLLAIGLWAFMPTLPE